jgi:hypothetical protein
MIQSAFHESKTRYSKKCRNIGSLVFHILDNSDWDGPQVSGPAGSLAPDAARDALASPLVECRETPHMSVFGSTHGSDHVESSL